MKEAYYNAFLHQSRRTALETKIMHRIYQSFSYLFGYFFSTFVKERQSALGLPRVTMATQATERFKEKAVSPLIKSSA